MKILHGWILALFALVAFKKYQATRTAQKKSTATPSASPRTYYDQGGFYA